MPATDFNKLSKELSGSTGILGSLLLFVIIALICILLFWANVTELDNVTRGQGKIVSSLQNQLVQASEGGVIKARFVEELRFKITKPSRAILTTRFLHARVDEPAGSSYGHQSKGVHLIFICFPGFVFMRR